MPVGLPCASSTGQKRLVHGASESPAFGRGSDVRKCMNLCMGHKNSSKDTVSRHNL